MRYSAVILSDMLREEIPETIKVDENTTLVIKETTVIINEIDKNVCPIHPVNFEKCFSVGLKALVERRRYKDYGDGRHSLDVEKDIIGDFAYITYDAPIKEIMDTIDALVRKLFNTVGEPTEA